MTEESILVIQPIGLDRLIYLVTAVQGDRREDRLYSQEQLREICMAAPDPEKKGTAQAIIAAVEAMTSLDSLVEITIT